MSKSFLSHPISSINGVISVPGDKSISHRAIIFGAIAQGETNVSGFLDGEDCLATLKAFQSMGVMIEGPINQSIRIHGVGKHGLKKPQGIIDCGNSGTSMRLLAGLMAAQRFDSVLTGDESLLNRPMMRVAKPLGLMGADIGTDNGKPPITIRSVAQLNGIEYLMPEASAQVKSCLLLAGMYAKNATIITETGISRDHTERMLQAFSYPILRKENTLIIQSDGECKALDIDIPGDISSAAFFIVAATITPGSDVTLTRVGVNPTRVGIIQILRAMGADIRLENQTTYGVEPVADIRVRYAPLTGITISEDLVPLAIDEFPAIFIAAACAKGRTSLSGAKELRLKESDRIGTMVEGLLRLGINAEGFDDGISIEGGVLQGGMVDSKGDHRIAMSFAIAGAVASEPILIKDCANVATSFPNFVACANRLSFHIEEQ